MPSSWSTGFKFTDYELNCSLIITFCFRSKMNTIWSVICRASTKPLMMCREFGNSSTWWLKEPTIETRDFLIAESEYFIFYHAASRNRNFGSENFSKEGLFRNIWQTRSFTCDDRKCEIEISKECRESQQCHIQIGARFFILIFVFAFFQIQLLNLNQTNDQSGQTAQICGCVDQLWKEFGFVLQNYDIINVLEYLKWDLLGPIYTSQKLWCQNIDRYL